MPRMLAPFLAAIVLPLALACGDDGSSSEAEWARDACRAFDAWTVDSVRIDIRLADAQDAGFEERREAADQAYDDLYEAATETRDELSGMDVPDGASDFHDALVARVEEVLDGTDGLAGEARAASNEAELGAVRAKADEAVVRGPSLSDLDLSEEAKDALRNEPRCVPLIPAIGDFL